MTHDDGTIEYVTIERADEPVEAGTAINKVLFDSIKNDIVADVEFLGGCNGKMIFLIDY